MCQTPNRCRKFCPWHHRTPEFVQKLSILLLLRVVLYARSALKRSLLALIKSKYLAKMKSMIKNWLFPASIKVLCSTCIKSASEHWWKSKLKNQENSTSVARFADPRFFLTKQVRYNEFLYKNFIHATGCNLLTLIV